MRKKLTKLMAVVLALVMVAALVPAVALATEEDATIADAAALVELFTGTNAKADGNKVTLLNNVTLKEKRPVITGTIELDLAGKTITKDNNMTLNTAAIKVGANGSLSITDSGSTAGGITGPGGLLLAVTGGTLSIGKGVVITSTGDASAISCTGGTLNITDGTITGGSRPAVNIQDGATAQITGGTISKTTNDNNYSAVQVGFGTDSQVSNVTIGGEAKINGSVLVLGKGNLTVEDKAVIDNQNQKFAISTNGTKDTSSTNYSKDAKITIKGGTITGANTACGVYLPAGKLTVTGGTISGGAGIIVRGGTLDVQGGIIEATSNAETVSSGDANPATVVPAGIAVDKNDAYEGKNTVTVSGGTVKAATGKPAISYSVTGQTGDQEPSEEEKIEVKGGTFLSGNNGDTNVNKYVASDVIINKDNGEVVAFTAEIVDFGYEESAKDAAEKAKVKNPQVDCSSWIDQTMWVTFKEPLPAGKKVELTLTFNGGKDNGEKDLVMTCVGDGTHKTFAWSFLNTKQTEGVKAKAGTYSVEADGVTGETTVAVPKLPSEDVVHFAPLNASATGYKEAMTVTVKEDNNVGQYYEVRFDTEKLPKTNGNSQDKYWLGWSLVAPTNATNYAISFAGSAETLNAPATSGKQTLELNVDGKGGSGVALYYEADNPKTDSAWVAVTWTDADGKPMGTTFIHVVFGNITYKPAGSAEINAVDGGSGFKADKAEAEKAIKAVWDGIRTAESGPDDVADNTLWAIFQHKELQTDGINYKYQVRKDGVSTAIIEPSEDVTVKNGVLLYFSLDDQLSSVENKGGKYVIELLKDNLPVVNAEVEVFEVTYKADKNVTGKDVTIYTDRAGLEAALADHPDGFEFTNGASMWDKSVSSNEKDPYTYEVKLNAYTYVAPPMPGTNPDNPDNPDNPPVVDPAKQFVDVPDVPANKWYRDALNYVLTTKPGVIEGTDGTHFSPNANLTRAAFAKILWALDGKETATAANPFTDVKAGAWYYDAVIWANAEGIMLGDAGRCKPEDNITREEMAVMIQRWLNGKAATTESKFTDAKDIHDWAAGAVNWAAEQGYIKGKDDGSFAPLATLTRAEMIVVVARTQGWIG